MPYCKSCQRPFALLVNDLCVVCDPSINPESMVLPESSDWEAIHDAEVAGTRAADRNGRGKNPHPVGSDLYDAWQGGFEGQREYLKLQDEMAVSDDVEFD